MKTIISIVIGIIIGIILTLAVAQFRNLDIRLRNVEIILNNAVRQQQRVQQTPQNE